MDRSTARIAASSPRRSIRTGKRRVFLACLLIPFLAANYGSACADTVSYEYDALGRLKTVTYSDGSVIAYTLDPAGNRTKVTSTSLPGIPSSITVPSSSSTGSYNIGWGTSTGTVTAYELYEAANAGFSGQLLAYSGTGTSKQITGKGNGTYYYRVRACNGANCSGYRTGGNGITVDLAPATPPPPANIFGPAGQTTGNYSISWSSSAGATRYELWESIYGGAFFKVYDGSSTSKGFSSKPDGEYRYKAKACNAAGCSGFSPTKLVRVCNGMCSLAAPQPPPE